MKTLAVASALILFYPNSISVCNKFIGFKRRKKSKLKQRKNELNSSISNKSNAITANQEKTTKKIIDQIQALNAEIDKTNSDIKKCTNRNSSNK
ncbi:hypothetical protein OL548_09925 [Lysinibacillus sp. MHQ-1]|nr:hypothetical protein OL548_09925 [Lysinibacillus sp. MHQ-1]